LRRSFREALDVSGIDDEAPALRAEVSTLRSLLMHPDAANVEMNPQNPSRSAEPKKNELSDEQLASITGGTTPTMPSSLPRMSLAPVSPVKVGPVLIQSMEMSSTVMPKV
jgi:bacteriocin-like protein